MLEIAGRSILILSCRFYLVIIQYITKLDTEKLRGLVRDLLPEDVRLSKKKYNFQLADEQTSYELSGFRHNAVTPFGMLRPVPVVCFLCVEWRSF